MNWTDVAKKAVSLGLPTLGGALFGGAGASVGGLIAKALGCDPTPEAVSAAMTPESMVALAKIQADERVQMASQASAERIEEGKTDAGVLENINSTMREESKSEHWAQWLWRPFIGFCFGFAFLFVALLVCFLAWRAVMQGRPEALTMIPALVSSMTTLFAIPGGILGVAAWHRGRMQVEEVKAAAAQAQ